MRALAAFALLVGCNDLAGIADLEIASASDSGSVTDAAAEADAKPCTAIVTGGTCPAGMALVPGGCYFTSHFESDVTVNAFCLDLTEVTAARYVACSDTGTCPKQGLTVTLSAGDDPSKQAIYDAVCTGRSPIDRAKHPINCVDWMAADAYCTSLGLRLPTSDEWEWAARGEGKGTLYPWGNDAPKNQLCWSGFAPAGSTCEVASFPAGDDPYGIADLAGNVAEWTSTPQPGISGRHVVRGGSWTDTLPTSVGWSPINYVTNETRNNKLGFRCAATP